MAVQTAHEVGRAARAKFLSDLNDVESPATAQMMQQYKIAMSRIASTMARVLKGGDEHSAAMLAGHETDIRIAMIQGRASYILGELDRFGAQGAAIVADIPKQAVTLGMAHATDRLSALSGAMVAPNPRRVAAMAARMSDGTPQRAYLDQFATRGTQRAVDSMTQCVLMGNHPDVILRDLSSQMSGDGANLATFVRSNVMGAARDGLTATMQDNSDVCTGWLWNCAEDDSTCDVCWGMNGTQHDVSEELDSHPNCRCIQDPTTQSYSDIVGSGGDASGGDLTDSSAQAFNPDDRFRSTLSEAQQLNVLGPGKFSLFQDGKITLADLVTKTQSPTWGPGLRSTTLTELQAKGIGQAPVIDQVARGQRK